MTIGQFAQVVAARWRWFAAAVVAGLFLTALTILLVPREYESTATLYISAFGGSDASAAYEGGLLSEQRVKSYSALMLSERIARDVIAAESLDMRPEEFQDKVSVSSQPETVLLNLTLEDRSPTAAADLANATASVFIRVVGEVERPVEVNRPASIVARQVQVAMPAAEPASPNVVLYLFVGLLLSFSAGLAAAWVAEKSDNSIRDRDELARLAGSAVLGGLPFDESLGEDSSTVMANPDSQVAEELRQLRTNLQFMDVDGEKSSIVITSSVAGEGKTTAAINLAVSMSNAGSRTLLVDADLRRPRLSTVLGLSEDVGLSSVISGRAGLVDCVQRWNSTRLDILACGPIPPNPSELLSSDRFARLILEAKAAYDVVLFDTTPLMPVTDASILSTKCDGVLVVHRLGSTSRRELVGALAKLRVVNSKILGVVASMERQSRRSYRAYGYGPVPAGGLYPEQVDPGTVEMSYGKHGDTRVKDDRSSES